MRKAGSSPWRRLLICWLALLLPLQSLAASAGLHCLGMAASGLHAPQARAAAAPPPCHEAPAEAAAPAAVPTADPAHAQASASAHAHAHAHAAGDADPLNADPACSACAACHMASAPPGPDIWVVAGSGGDTLVPAMSGLQAGVGVPGLERPPRHLGR